MLTDYRHGLTETASFDDLVKQVLDPPKVDTQKIDEERAPIDVRNGFVHSQLDQIADSVNLAGEAAIQDQAKKQGRKVAPPHVPADDGNPPLPKRRSRNHPHQSQHLQHPPLTAGSLHLTML